MGEIAWDYFGKVLLGILVMACIWVLGMPVKYMTNEIVKRRTERGEETSFGMHAFALVFSAAFFAMIVFIFITAAYYLGSWALYALHQ